MYKLVKRYYGELCDKEQRDDREVYDEEVVFEHTFVAFVEKELQKQLQEEVEKGFVIDEEKNKDDYVILFWEYQENWNAYIEVLIIKDNRELEDELRDLANSYDEKNSEYVNSCLLLLEDNFKVHFQELKNSVAKLVIEKRLKKFKGSRTINNKTFINFIRDLEKEFECEIDLIDFTITPNLQ